MSLEQALEKNTAAMVAITGALNANTAALLGRPAQPSAPAASTPPAQPQKTTTPTGGAQSPAGDQAQAPAVTYEAVAKVVSDLVKVHGRGPAEILLKPFGVRTLVPLKDKPAELAAAYAAFTDKAKTDAAIAETAAAPKG